MQIDLEIDSTLQTLVRELQEAPAKTDKAIQRALRKLSSFAERQVLRALSRATQVSQKQIKELGRVRLTLHKPGERSEDYELVIWIGLNDIPAHYLGRPVQNSRGVRTGRHFWESAFTVQPASSSQELVFQRAPDWKHKKQLSLKNGRTIWMGLPIEKVSLPIAEASRKAIDALQPQLFERFSTLVQQELNYAFRIE